MGLNIFQNHPLTLSNVMNQLILYNRMQAKDINIEEIVSALNGSSHNNEHFSYRLSDDYQPFYDRYSKQDQLQEITFELSSENSFELHHQSVDNEVIIKEENNLDKLSDLLGESTQQPVTIVKEQKPPALSKKISLSKKNSLKTSERLKKKISIKKESDEFTKKYDDLFDEIFLKQKEKDKKQEDKSSQPTLLEANSSSSSSKQNLSNSTVSQESTSLSNIIDRAFEALISRNEQNKQKMVHPKISISYQTKIMINIKPPVETNAKVAQNNCNRPKIKFSYGQSEPILSSKKHIDLNIDYSIKQQERIPKFLMPFRRISNSYPNFYSKTNCTSSNFAKLNAQFKQMVKECKKALMTLKESHLKLHNMIGNVRQLYKKLSLNILKQNGEQNKQLLDYFTSNNWESYLKAPQLDLIRPREYFLRREFNELQFITFMNNFQQILAKLQQQDKLDHSNAQSTKIYMQGRDQLWAIQKNLRLLSQDLYLYMISHFNLPSHFIISHHILNNTGSNIDNEAFLNRILFLQEKKDILGASYIGGLLIDRLVNNK